MAPHSKSAAKKPAEVETIRHRRPEHGRKREKISRLREAVKVAAASFPDNPKMQLKVWDFKLNQERGKVQELQDEIDSIASKHGVQMLEATFDDDRNAVELFERAMDKRAKISHLLKVIAALEIDRKKFIQENEHLQTKE